MSGKYSILRGNMGEDQFMKKKSEVLRKVAIYTINIMQKNWETTLIVSQGAMDYHFLTQRKM